MLKEFEKRLISSVILIPIVIFFVLEGSVFFIFFLSILFLATSYEWFKMSKKNHLLKLSGIIFLLFSFYSAFNIREEGLIFFLFILTICVFTDIGGYTFGKTFKGPKLGKISPNKTFAGVLGSFILSLVFALIYIKFLGKETFLFDTDNFTILLIILFISFISQLGDLIISYFKRKAKLKDTGKILPGHGGILDRIDGLVFVMPSIYFLYFIK